MTTPEFVGRPNVTLLNDQTTFGPEEWHGTFVASVAAAAANGVGIVGVYPQAALEIWDASPVSNIVSFSAAVGIETAAQHCPTVINLSFGSLSPSPLITDAIIYAQHRGCLVVASGGNDGQHGSPPTFPAGQAHVLTVAATDENDAAADFSTVSPTNDLAAPGVGIIGAVTLSFDPTGFSTAGRDELLGADRGRGRSVDLDGAADARRDAAVPAAALHAHATSARRASTPRRATASSTSRPPSPLRRRRATRSSRTTTSTR